MISVLFWSCNVIRMRYGDLHVCSYVLFLVEVNFGLFPSSFGETKYWFSPATLRRSIQSTKTALARVSLSFFVLIDDCCPAAVAERTHTYVLCQSVVGRLFNTKFEFFNLILTLFTVIFVLCHNYYNKTATTDDYFKWNIVRHINFIW